MVDIQSRTKRAWLKDAHNSVYVSRKNPHDFLPEVPVRFRAESRGVGPGCWLFWLTGGVF